MQSPTIFNQVQSRTSPNSTDWIKPEFLALSQSHLPWQAWKYIILPIWLMKFQLSSFTHFGFRAFQSFRQPRFCVSTLQSTELQYCLCSELKKWYFSLDHIVPGHNITTISMSSAGQLWIGFQKKRGKITFIGAGVTLAML